MKVPQNSRLDDLEQELSEARDDLHRELALVRKRVTDLEDENEDVRETIETLSDRLSVLKDQMGQPQGKDTKVAALVEYADNKRDPDQKGAKLGIQEIKGTTGCSRRYAYDLVEELPEEYACVVDQRDADNFGGAELANDSVGLFVDVELAHEDDRLVNHLTTQTAEGER